eukprot:3614860-Rhodomonas_salina.3
MACQRNSLTLWEKGYKHCSYNPMTRDDCPPEFWGAAATSPLTRLCFSSKILTNKYTGLMTIRLSQDY